MAALIRRRQLMRRRAPRLKPAIMTGRIAGVKLRRYQSASYRLSRPALIAAYTRAPFIIGLAENIARCLKRNK